MRPDLAEADMIVFLGDFNYRLYGITYDEARDMVSQRSFDWLREKDQLRAEMKAGKVFQGMREGIIKFPPTYKFELLSTQMRRGMQLSLLSNAFAQTKFPLLSSFNTNVL